MHIKSIHLDGFKSYQKHTDITGFSSQFNAITGYNGSGKSNVLDSICFILGINKLDNIRAKSMSELITHGGTKATVSIRFDNRDKSTSPYAMESFDEITVQRTITAQATGKGCATSYTLNGHAATNSRIQDFFRGIGLNVNNPHFLIMQGRITTVLNMKPEEILGMVEEAAGTKMYDQKKKEAEKTLFLKETKLKEIDRIFNGSIDPRMEKFREDRKNMVEVQRLVKAKDNATRKMDAYLYHTNRDNLKRDIEAIEHKKKEIEDCRKRIDRINNDVEIKNREKADIENQRDTNNAENAAISAQASTQNDYLAAENELKNSKEAVKKAEKEITRINQSLAKDRKTLEAKRAELDKIRAANSNDIDTHKQNEELVCKLREELESLTRGTVANDKGEHVSVESVIQDTKSDAARLEASIKTAGNRLGRARNRIQTLEGQKQAEFMKTDAGPLKRYENEMAQLEEKIADLGINVAQNKEVREKHRALTRRAEELDSQMSKLLGEISSGRYAMTFTPPPVASFDARKDVIGLIAHLMKIKPGRENFGAAIDIAGQSMYTNVVVRSQEIARVLIDSKAFTGRRTMIPVEENDRADTRSKVLGAEAVARAQAIADRFNETVVKFIDLISFPKNIDNTFNSSFGQILVVESLQCAKEIAYDPQVRTRVLTRRGDDVKPNGVMAGGHIEQGETSILVSFRPYHVLKDEYDSYTGEIASLQEFIDQTDATFNKYQELENQLTSLGAKAATLKRNIENSSYGMIVAELEELKKTVESTQAEIEENTKRLAEVEAKVRDLESKRSSDKGSQDRRKKELTSKLQEAEKATFSKKEAAEKARRVVLHVQAAVDDLQTNILADENNLQTAKKNLEEAQEKLPLLSEKLEIASRKNEEALVEMNQKRDERSSLISRLTATMKSLETLKREETKSTIKIDELEKNIKTLEEKVKLTEKEAQVMLKRCEWLEEELPHLNKKGGLYDFDGYTNKKGNDEIKDYAEKIEKIERSLCMKNVSNLDTCEARVIDIKTKRERLQDDFDALEKTIQVLDKKKVDELKRAHESVNRDFGTIFHCLLPDADARLVPPEGKTVTDGLEVKVSFNKVEKDSLHELSGGQRSLVALSLILAMLKFKPAPLYILDEVDAALDLSHTANIGMMIKTHFRNHQFIIVSLKQGMFSNADSLFQTSFADGHSNCRMLTGDALLRAKNDAKLAEQAAEMEDPGNTQKKTKKSQKKTVRLSEDDD